MRVIKSAPRYISEIKQLWTDSFGDNEKFNEFYFNERYDHQNSYILINERREVIAMLQNYDYDLKCGNDIYSGSYIYGACTKKNLHNRGYMSRLLSEVIEINRKNNKTFSCLVPANEPLFNFYEKFGYQKAFYYYSESYEKNAALSCANKMYFKKADIKDFLLFEHLYNEFSKTKSKIILQGNNLFSMYREHLIYDDILINENSYIILTKKDGDIVVNEHFGIKNKADLLYNIKLRYDKFDRITLLNRQAADCLSKRTKAYGMIKILNDVCIDTNKIYMNMMMD